MVSPVLKQTWIATGVILSLLNGGMLVAYPYSLLSALNAKDSPIKIDLHMGALLASAFTFTIFIGLIITSILMEWIGRTKTFALLLLPNIAGWILMYFSSNFTSLMISRMLGGVWAGSSYIGSVILGEFTSPEYRGIFIAFKTTGFVFGSMLTHIMSKYFDWRTVALISSVPVIIALFSTIIWPESPYWLATKGNYSKSERAFYYLRGTTESSVRELETLIQTQKERVSRESRRLNIEGTKNYFKNVAKAEFIKPILVIFAAHILMEASGRHYFPGYAANIVGKINGDIMSQNFSIVLTIDSITLLSSTISSILSKNCNRRLLLFTSGIASIALLALICLYTLLVSQEIISNLRPWVPISMLVTYYFVTTLGLAPIPLILTGELLPLRLKGTAMTISGLLISLPLMLFLKITPIMLANINIYGTFATYGLVMISMLTYLYFALPETHNKTLQDIESFFSRKKLVKDEIKQYDDEKAKEMLYLNINFA